MDLNEYQMNVFSDQDAVPPGSKSKFSVRKGFGTPTTDDKSEGHHSFCFDQTKSPKEPLHFPLVTASLEEDKIKAFASKVTLRLEEQEQDIKQEAATMQAEETKGLEIKVDGLVDRVSESYRRIKQSESVRGLKRRTQESIGRIGAKVTNIKMSLWSAIADACTG